MLVIYISCTLLESQSLLNSIYKLMFLQIIVCTLSGHCFWSNVIAYVKRARGVGSSWRRSLHKGEVWIWASRIQRSELACCRLCDATETARFFTSFKLTSCSVLCITYSVKNKNLFTVLLLKNYATLCAP